MLDVQLHCVVSADIETEEGLGSMYWESGDNHSFIELTEADGSKLRLPVDTLMKVCSAISRAKEA